MKRYLTVFAVLFVEFFIATNFASASLGVSADVESCPHKCQSTLSYGDGERWKEIARYLGTVLPTNVRECDVNRFAPYLILAIRVCMDGYVPMELNETLARVKRFADDGVNYLNIQKLVQDENEGLFKSLSRDQYKCATVSATNATLVDAFKLPALVGPTYLGKPACEVSN